MEITEKDFNEIIAIQFDDQILFGKEAIKKALELKDFTRDHSRAVFKFMSVLDLDCKWKEYSQYPTLFTFC